VPQTDAIIGPSTLYERSSPNPDYCHCQFCGSRRSREHHFYLDETRLATVQNDGFGNDRRLETAEYWRVRSQEARSRAEQMVNPESRHLMYGLADDYDRAAHIVEGNRSAAL
jgi:hypothetical protein